MLLIKLSLAQQVTPLWVPPMRGFLGREILFISYRVMLNTSKTFESFNKPANFSAVGFERGMATIIITIPCSMYYIS